MGREVSVTERHGEGGECDRRGMGREVSVTGEAWGGR